MITIERTENREGSWRQQLEPRKIVISLYNFHQILMLRRRSKRVILPCCFEHHLMRPRIWMMKAKREESRSYFMWCSSTRAYYWAGFCFRRCSTFESWLSNKQDEGILNWGAMDLMVWRGNVNKRFRIQTLLLYNWKKVKKRKIRDSLKILYSITNVGCWIFEVVNVQLCLYREIKLYVVDKWGRKASRAPY